MSTTEIVLDAVPLDDDLADIVFTGLDRSTHHGVEIGRGSQGSVSRIKVEDQGLDVAVKSILMSNTESLSQLDRLEREAAVLQSLPNHPSVARYLGYRTREIPRTGSIDTEYSILMEYVDGDPLSVAVGKPIDDTTLLDYCDQMYSTLGFLHTHNVIHRDIKPSNVMRLKDGTLKVIDFGLVKKTDWTTMTISRGAFLGSLNYAAPEIEDGKSATAAADLYSLAVMLTALKRGKEFSYRDRPDDIRAALKEMHFNKPELKERLEAMLCDDPEKRMERVKLVDGKYVYDRGQMIMPTSVTSRIPTCAEDIVQFYIRMGRVSEREKRKYDGATCRELMIERGAKKFRQKIMGRFHPWEMVRSPEEMASILYDVGMVPSSKDGMQFLELIKEDSTLRIDGPIRVFQYHHFTNALGEEKYVIQRPSRVFLFGRWWHW